MNFHKSSLRSCATHTGIKELTELDQWVYWRYEYADGRWTKPPINPKTLRYASVTKPWSWGSYEAVDEVNEVGKANGIGFVVTEGDPYCGVDLDDCRNPETGAIEEWAQKFVDRFDSYTEASPTGTGLHIIVRAKLPPNAEHEPFDGIEVYDCKRYFTITRDVVLRRPIRLAQEAAEELTAPKYECDEGTTAFICPPNLRVGEVKKQAGDIMKSLGIRSILQGTRNNTLLSVGAYLRLGGLIYEDIISLLSVINDTYCDPPLSYKTLEGIVRENCKLQINVSSVEVNHVLDILYMYYMAYITKGRTAATDRDVLLALVSHGRKRYGSMVQKGVRIDISLRTLKDLAKTTLNTVQKTLDRLEKAGEIIRGWDRGDRSGHIVLKVNQAIDRDTGEITYHPGVLNCTLEHASSTQGKCSTPLHYPVQKPHVFRWGGIGKSKAMILDGLITMGGKATTRQLEQRLGKRAGSLSRHLKYLSNPDVGILVKVRHGVYQVPENVEEIVQRERKNSGEIEKDRRESKRTQDERRKYAEWPSTFGHAVWQKAKDKHEVGHLFKEW